MQQNQVILLVVILAVVIIGIVVAVMMMGQPPQQAQPYMPNSGMQNTGLNIPQTQNRGATPPAGNGDIAAAIAAGSPVSCKVTMDMGAASGDSSMAGQSASMNILMESPKMYAEGNAMGMSYTLIFDGTTAYMKMPMMGDDWYMMEGDPSTMSVPTAEDIREGLSNMPEGTTMDCQLVGDIPDSKFTLPPGVTAVDMSEMYGSDMSAYGY